MNRSAIKPTRRRFFSLRGSGIEFAIGLVAVSLLEAERANAAVIKQRGIEPRDSDAVARDLHAALGHLADVDPAAVKALSVDELKALLTPEALASLGLSHAFLRKLDTDPESALRKLEAAFRKKVAAVAAHNHEVRAADERAGGAEHVAAGDSDHLRDGDAVHQDAALFGGIPLIWPLLGAALVGGIVVAASKGGGGDSHDNHAPLANSDSVTTAEDTPVTFDVRANDSDRDGDALTVTHINGTAISTTSPVSITGGTVSLGSDGRLTFTPSRDYNGSPSFTYTISDGRGGNATATTTLTVTPVNDAPVNAIANAMLSATTGVASVVAGLSVSDVDSSNLTTTVTVTHGLLTLGQVSGGATVSGLGTASLTLTGTSAQINASLGVLTFTATQGFVGTDKLTIVTNDGSLTDTDTLTLTVGRAVAGFVQDGYIAGAQVFIDVNGNGVLDTDEPITTTNADGSYAFATGITVTGNIVAVGGVNIDTGLRNNAVLSAPMGSSVVNPLTTLVAEQVKAGLSVAEATAAVVAVLGLPAGTNITAFDYLSPNVDRATALVAFKAAVQIVTIINAAVEAGVSPTAAAAALAKAVQAASDVGGAINFASPSVVTSILIQSGVSEAEANTAAVSVAAINQAVAAATSQDAVSETVKDLNQPNADLPPVASDDAATGDNGHTLRFNVLDNDKDPEGGLLKLTKIDGVAIGANPITVAGGTLIANADGSISFTANPGFTGTPQFVYTVEDAAGHSAQATVNLTINPATGTPIAPTAASDTAATSASVSVAIDVLANDNPGSGVLSVTHVNGQVISTTRPVAVDGGTVLLDASGRIVFTPNLAHTGSTSFQYTVTNGSDGTSDSTVTVTVGNASDPVLSISALDLPDVLAHAGDLHNIGFTTLDVSGDGFLTLTQGQADALIGAGLHFADADTITVTAEGTHVSTTLKALRDLHVDNIVISGAGAISVDAGGLDLTGGRLPHFQTAAGGAVDVTLNASAGTFDTLGDLTGVAGQLADAGIHHINFVGGTGSLTLAQAQSLVGAGIDATLQSDVRLTLTEAEATSIDTLLPIATSLHVDHLDVTTDAVSLTETQAAALIAAGLDFVDADVVTVVASGTHMSTTLKGLQDLRVDAVMLSGASTLVIDAGTTDLGGLTAHSLPHFDSMLDVTLDIASGTLPSSFDMGHVGSLLAQAGVDHLGVGGDGHLSLSVAQAQSFAMSGLDFADRADITLVAAPFEVGALADNPFALTGMHIDRIEAGGAVVLTDQQATNLVEAGLSFADNDVITVAAAGTHLSTSLKALQDLHVDTITVQAGITQLHIDAGDLHTVDASGLPLLDPSLDVTLRVDAGEAGEVVRLAHALELAGIDHIALNAPLSSLDAQLQAALANAAAANHLTITQEQFSGSDVLGLTNGAGGAAADSAQFAASIYRDLLTEFENHADNTGHGGVLQLVDGAASSLAEAGMLRAYTAEKLIVDGTTSGDHLLTTLKDIADIGVDQIKVADHGAAPVYIDLGVQGGSAAISDIQSLFNTLDLERVQAGTANEDIVTGTSKVGLVVDVATADALAHVDGALAKLANFGITEVDVLNTTGTGASPLSTANGVEVKLIGQDDQLYQHLHHAGG